MQGQAKKNMRKKCDAKSSATNFRTSLKLFKIQSQKNAIGVEVKTARAASKGADALRGQARQCKGRRAETRTRENKKPAAQNKNYRRRVVGAGQRNSKIVGTQNALGGSESRWINEEIYTRHDTRRLWGGYQKVGVLTGCWPVRD